MAKIFLDANIFIDLVEKRAPEDREQLLIHTLQEINWYFKQGSGFELLAALEGLPPPASPITVCLGAGWSNVYNLKVTNQQ